jgi:alkylation response protein AidB-like acyl-CoA dehydrogenase
MFVVHRDNPGFRFGGTYETLGLKGAGVGHFTLRNCFVPDADVFGEVGQGFYQMMAMVEFGRTGVAAMCVGIAQRAIDSAVQFLTDRVSFGRKLSDNDVILAAIADMRIKLDAARLLTERAANMFDAGQRCTVEAAVAKVFASEVAVDTTSAALHLHGGIGFTNEMPIERFFRDCQAFTIGEGTSEVLRMVIGRSEFAQSRPSN